MHKITILLITPILFLSVFSATSQVTIDWEKSFGGSANECAYSVQQTADEGYIIAGTSESTNGDVTENKGSQDVWVLKLTKAAEIEWQKSFGGSATDFPNSIQITKDGGYIFAATASSNNGDVKGSHGLSEAWIVKLASNGEITWQKCLGGSGTDTAYSVQQTNDGGYIVVGNTESTNGDVTNNYGKADVWVVKLTNEGDIVWQKSFGGENYEQAHSIQQTSDGGYIVAGSSKSVGGDLTTNKGYYDYWIIKLTDQGSIVWQKTMGGNRGDFSNSIQQTNDGGYIVAGSSESRDGDIIDYHYGMDYWVVKLTSKGDIDWQKCLGGSHDDSAYSIQQTKDDGYIVVGYTSAQSSYIGKRNDDVIGFHGDMDYWAVKLSNKGDLVWQKCLGGTGSDMAFCVQQTTDGGYVIVGTSNSIDGDRTTNKGKDDLWIVKLGSNQKK